VIGEKKDTDNKESDELWRSVGEDDARDSCFLRFGDRTQILHMEMRLQRKRRAFASCNVARSCRAQRKIVL